METRQLATYISTNVSDAMKEFSEETRMPIRWIVEDAIKMYLEAKGKVVKPAKKGRSK